MQGAPDRSAIIKLRFEIQEILKGGLSKWLLGYIGNAKPPATAVTRRRLPQ